MTMLPRKNWSKKVTDDAIMAAADRRCTTLDDPGFCLACGVEAGGVEPDAQNYTCEACGEDQVFGVEELVMEIA